VSVPKNAARFRNIDGWFMAMSADQISADPIAAGSSHRHLLSLASLTMAELRELARKCGLGLGYSAMSRSQLLDALQQPIAAAVQDAAEPGTLVEIPAAELPDSASWVSFVPRDPQWASVFWQLNGAERQRALAAGAQQLCLRVADVTGLPTGATHPHTLQEVVVDGGAREWYLPVPLSDRDYRVELGYRLTGGGWLSLAVSAVARVPAESLAAPGLPGFAPFSIDPDQPLQAALPAPLTSAGVEHERFYQQAMAVSPQRLRQGSETFHEHEVGVAGSNLHQVSGAGVWASGRTESGAGPARARSFWLVADAELIVYGATEPSATLTIGERQVPLESDGRFHLHVPFADGEQVYPIRALAADGEQERSIRLDVQRRTPEARVNSREAAQLEWF
jgi:uncharacterized protein